MSYVLILITIFLFSTLEVTGKLIGHNISPSAVTIYRFMLGGIVLLPFAISKIKQRKEKLYAKDFFKLAIPGIINVAISMLSLQYAIYYGKASVTAVLISTNPLFAAIFARFLLKQEFTFKKFIGMVIGIIGVIIIIGTDEAGGADVINHELGILFACIASVTFGFYTALSIKYVKHYGSTVANSIAFLIGSVVLLTITLLLGGSIEFEPVLPNFIFLGYLGVFVTGIAYILYFQGLKHVPASIGSMFFFLKPIIASILAYILFKENLDIWQYFGFIIVLFGINFDKLTSKKKHKIQT